MKESSIEYEAIQITTNENPSTCALLTNGLFPTKSLSGEQIKKAISFIKSKKLEANLNCDIKDVDWVISVENEQLVLAAEAGKKVTLIPTGFGENLFKKMFPSCEILKI